MNKKKHLFLAVTGLFPQVLTESLYGIISNEMEWPDEIKVITTKTGKQKIVEGVLAPIDGKPSKLALLCADYEKVMPSFNEEDILVVPDAQGNLIDDPRNVHDQEALADFIVNVVGDLCSDDAVQLHASIAGGRKTMTFYLGYAMTLFARMGDKLSHVLVDRKFEAQSDFYYPTPQTQMIADRFSDEKLDISKAEVVLTEIPFIRHRGQLHRNALHNLSNESYREMTYLQNLVNAKKLKVDINISKKSVEVSAGGVARSVSFADDRLNFAFILLIGQCAINNSVIERPKTRHPDKLLASLYLQCVDRVFGYFPLACSAENKEQWAAVNELRLDNLDKVSRTVGGLKLGMKCGFFDDRKNQVKERLVTKLPIEVVDFILMGFKHRLADSEAVITKSTSITPIILFSLLEPDYQTYKGARFN